MSKEINEIKKLAGLTPLYESNDLTEHKDYDSYVKELEDDGYTVEVTESDDSLVFKVSKDSSQVTVKEPQTGAYRVSGDAKTYSSLRAAVKAHCKPVNEWANSPDNQYEEREFERDTAEGEIVDLSLRKHIGGKPMPVRVQESSMFDVIDRLRTIEEMETKNAKPDYLDLDDDGDTEESMKKAAKDKKKQKVDEGIKSKLKALAFLGLTGMAAHQAMDKFSPKNSPLGQALQHAAEQGDDYAQEHLENLGAYFDQNAPILRTLNHQYLQEGTTTSAEILESYISFKTRG